MIKLTSAIISLLIYILGIFILPGLIVDVIKNPTSYWDWVAIVIWVYLLADNIVSSNFRHNREVE